MSRKERIQRALRAKKLDAFLVTHIRNVGYLTGFRGSSAFVFVTRDRGFFYTDFRYREQAEQEVSDWEIGIEKGKRVQSIRRLVETLGVKSLGFESTVDYGFAERLSGLPVSLFAQRDLVEAMRKVKDDDEIAQIRTAVRRAESAFLQIKPKIRVGVTEREIALRLEYRLRRAGCGTIPFEVIVASGKNSSMPHARPTDKKIEAGDFVIIDWGGESDGYFSDMTRTLLMDGGDLSFSRKIYEIVNTARERAVRSVRAGAKSRDIDREARDYIRAKGFGEFFGHGTGHGVDLDVHEGPRISPVSSGTVSEGMVFTIEPGIYIPGRGGVRIEDMVLVRGGDAQTLTGLGRALEIVRA